MQLAGALLQDRSHELQAVQAGAAGAWQPASRAVHLQALLDQCAAAPQHQGVLLTLSHARGRGRPPVALCLDPQVLPFLPQYTVLSAFPCMPHARHFLVPERRCPGHQPRCRHTAPAASVAPPAEVPPATTADAGAGPSSNGSAGSSEPRQAAAPLTFQEAIARLQQYWASVGCTVTLPFNSEVTCGTTQLHMRCSVGPRMGPLLFPGLALDTRHGVPARSQAEHGCPAAAKCQAHAAHAMEACFVRACLRAAECVRVRLCRWAPAP